MPETLLRILKRVLDSLKFYNNVYNTSIEILSRFLNGNMNDIVTQKKLVEEFTTLSKTENKEQIAAFYMLALFARESFHMQYDQKRIFEIFTSAVKLGFLPAYISVAGSYRVGRDGFEKNEKLAFEIAQIPFNLGDRSGFPFLALYYLYGSGVTQNIKRAVEIIEQSLKENMELCLQPEHCFVEALKIGDLQMIDYLIEQKLIDLHKRDNIIKVSPLIFAAAAGQIEVFEKLRLKYKLNTNETDQSGYNALHFAAGSGKDDMVCHILDNKYIDLNSVGNGVTALYWALAYKHIQTAELLLNRGAHVDFEWRAKLVSGGKLLYEDLELLTDAKYFLEPFVKKDKEYVGSRIKKVINATYIKDGNSALHYVLLNEKQNKGLAIELIAEGARADIANKQGITCMSLLGNSEEPELRTLWYFLKSTMAEQEISNIEESPEFVSLHSGLDEDIEMKSSKDSKESIGPKNLKELKEQAEKRSLIINETKIEKLINEGLALLDHCHDDYKNDFYFLWGKFLGDEKNPINAVKACELLMKFRVRNDSFVDTCLFEEANGIIYYLLLNGKIGFSAESFDDDNPIPVPKQEIVNSPEQEDIDQFMLIKYLVLSGIQDEPLGNFLSQFLNGSERSLRGIPNFSCLSDPDSFLALVIEMKKENAKIREENKNLTEKLTSTTNTVISYEKEIMKLKKELSELQAKQKNEIKEISESSSSSSASSSSSVQASLLSWEPHKRQRIDTQADQINYINTSQEQRDDPQNESDNSQESADNARKRKRGPNYG